MVSDNNVGRRIARRLWEPLEWVRFPSRGTPQRGNMSEKGWSEQEEAKIAELMKNDKLTRIAAIQKMQRLKHDKKWRPTDV